jgi:glycosyltransferase involved in cell wall biosynthesis
MDSMIPAYTVVIPTSGRDALLTHVLESLVAQTVPPEQIIVVDAGNGTTAEKLCKKFLQKLPLIHLPATVRSAAAQRNQGAALAQTPAVVFCDDDMRFGPATLALLVKPLSHGYAGIAARIEGCTHPRPGGTLRGYYRWQAGYRHPHFGARLFGPAINTWPCYSVETDTLIPAQWLNSALVAYRSDVFALERFPDFSGYSYMEDVHLSARIARRHQIAFHREASCEHLGTTSTAQSLPRAELVAMQWANRIRVAREVMLTPPARLRRQLHAHRAFVSLYLLRARPSGWRQELSALLRLNFTP